MPSSTSYGVAFGCKISRTCFGVENNSDGVTRVNLAQPRYEENMFAFVEAVGSRLDKLRTGLVISSHVLQFLEH